MSNSQFLAKAFGLYLVIITVGMLLHTSQFMGVMNEVLHNNAVMFLGNIVTLILGIILVLSHNVWRKDYRGLITVLCWFTLIKGTVHILFPHVGAAVHRAFMQHHALFYVDAVIFLIIGIYLCVKGFNRKRAG